MIVLDWRLRVHIPGPTAGVGDRYMGSIYGLYITPNLPIVFEFPTQELPTQSNNVPVLGNTKSYLFTRATLSNTWSSSLKPPYMQAVRVVTIAPSIHYPYSPGTISPLWREEDSFRDTVVYQPPNSPYNELPLAEYRLIVG